MERLLLNIPSRDFFDDDFIAKVCTRFPENKKKENNEKKRTKKKSEGEEKIIESAHPYPHNANSYTSVQVDYAVSYEIKFDSRSKTENGCDYIVFYKDDLHTEKWGESKYSGGQGSSSRNFPGTDGRSPLIIPAPRFVIYFRSDGSCNDWGYKIHIIPTLELPKSAVPEVNVDDLADIFLQSDFNEFTSADIYSLINDQMIEEESLLENDDPSWPKRQRILDNLNSAIEKVITEAVSADRKDDKIPYQPNIVNGSIVPALQNRIDESLIEFRAEEVSGLNCLPRVSVGDSDGNGEGQEEGDGSSNGDSAYSSDHDEQEEQDEEEEEQEQELDGHASPVILSHAWIEAAFIHGPQTVSAYALCSASDAPHRDPVEWTLEGLDPETNMWHVLHVQHADFTARGQWLAFAISSPKPVAKVKLNFDKVRESRIGVQLGQFHLFSLPVVLVDKSGGGSDGENSVSSNSGGGSGSGGDSSSSTIFSWGLNSSQVNDSSSDVVLATSICTSMAAISGLEGSRKEVALSKLCTSLTKVFSKTLPSLVPLPAT
jgi:hypothetical protein